MERLSDKYQAANNAAERLEEVMTLYSKRYDGLDDVEKRLYVGSIIKHFELCYETLWKFLKLYLQEEYGVRAGGSKDVFRELVRQQLVDERASKILLDTVDIRNATVHTYDEEFAQSLCKDIAKAYPAMRTALDAATMSTR